MPTPPLHTLLPHQGSALWLEQINTHNATSIQGQCLWSCLADFGERPSAGLLFEAAAQLCAAHGALYGNDTRIQGAYIGKLSKLTVHHDPLERCNPISIEAQQLSHSLTGALYSFRLTSQQQLLIDGTLLLVLVHA